MGLKELVRQVAPARAWSAMRSARVRLEDALWRHDSRAIASRKRLRSFKNLYADRRCFILCNGPSLRKTDLSLLKNEITFGLNRIYLAFEELGFATTFLVSINSLVIRQCAREMGRQPCTKFLTWRARRHIRFTDDMILLRSRHVPCRRSFYHNPAYAVNEGSTVTYVAMQLAFYMGFDDVVLIGVDHSFATSGPPDKRVRSTGNDPDHFHPSYFGKGWVWQLPDLASSEQHYRIAKEEYERQGGRIRDATIGGKLSVFPKVDYLSLFQAHRPAEVPGFAV